MHCVLFTKTSDDFPQMKKKFSCGGVNDVIVKKKKKKERKERDENEECSMVYDFTVAKDEQYFVCTVFPLA